MSFPIVFDVEKFLFLFYLVYDSLESFGVVHGQVGEHLAVYFDAGFVDEAHQLAVGKVFHAGGGVDTLYPERAEVAFLLLAVAVGIRETLFPSVLGYGPYIATATIITAGKFQDFFPFCT